MNVDGRHLDLHPVSHQHADEIPVHPIGNVGRNLLSRVEPHSIQRLRQLFGDDSRYRRAATGTSLAVRIHAPLAVIATVCSKCADRLLSRVTAVQPSDSTLTTGFPAFTIGSIASTMPSASRGPRPASP